MLLKLLSRILQYIVKHFYANLFTSFFTSFKFSSVIQNSKPQIKCKIKQVLVNQLLDFEKLN